MSFAQGQTCKIECENVADGVDIYLCESQSRKCSVKTGDTLTTVNANTACVFIHGQIMGITGTLSNPTCASTEESLACTSVNHNVKLKCVSM